MKYFQILLKKELFSASIRPSVYIACIGLAVFPALFYFITTRFFTFGLGSSNLQIFFTAIPYFSILTVPVLIMPLWNGETALFDMQLPVSDMQLILSKWLASFVVYCIALIPTAVVPITVSFYGDIDAGQIFCGYTGIILFGAAACSAGQFFSLLAGNRAAVFLITSLVLAAANSVHLIPEYIHCPDTVITLCRYISFSWHFNSAGKGILDSRDIIFYCTLTAFFLTASVFHLDSLKKTQISITEKLIRLFSAVLAILILMCAQRGYLRFDLTKSKQFSVSQPSRDVLSELRESLHITYYLSAELKERYPQIRDVTDFLYEYADSGNTVTVSIIDPQKEELTKALAAMGIYAQQIQTTNTNSVEFISVYSAIVCEYLDRTAILPLVFAVPGLEFEITSRVKAIAQDFSREIFVIAGNGLNLTEEYSIALEWCEQAGFACHIFTPEEFAAQIETITTSTDRSIPLVLFGSSALTQEQAAAVERFVAAGGTMFCAVSPVSIEQYTTWNAKLNTDDIFFPVLNKWGFNFQQALIQDVSCFRLQLGTGDETEPEYIYRNYPLWLNILPQYCAAHPITEAITTQITLFWSSPLVLNNVQSDDKEQTLYIPLIYTTPAACLQKADFDTGIQFLTDPFQLQNMQSNTEQTQYLTAAAAEGVFSGYYTGEQSSNTRIVIVSGDLTVSSLMLNYTGSSGNLDFLINSLLWLNYEDDMLLVRNKLPANTALYKADEKKLAASQLSVMTISAIVPIIYMTLIGSAVYILRKKEQYAADTQ